MKKFLAGLTILALLAPSPPARAASNVVVVELFTSQGCAVCNPANQFLGELTAERSVLALTWTVDYWDYLGWKDTMAAKSHTSRQEAYNAELANKSVQTPQVVVNGRRPVNGAQKLAVVNAIQQSSIGAELPISVTFQGADDTLRARVSGGAQDEGTYVYLIWYKTRADVAVTKGENAGKHLTFANVVVGFKTHGEWKGGTIEIPISMAEAAKRGADGFVVLVQDGEGGPIHGAGSVALTPVRP